MSSQAVAALSLLSLATSPPTSHNPLTVPRSSATTSVSNNTTSSTPPALSPPHTSPSPPAQSDDSSTTEENTFNSPNVGRLSSLSGSAPYNVSRSGIQITGASSVSGHSSRPLIGHGGQPKQRRLSSTGQSRRRLSDATAATIQAAATADFVRGTSISSNGTSVALATSTASPPVPNAQVSSLSAAMKSAKTAIPLTNQDEASGTGKRRGQIYKCESCSKVYRHPNCLLKHRWEHSPHWREASKFLLSKHQQVQLLEAAAILSHITPNDPDGVQGGTSLPEDRSLWPSYLSGGLLPAPSTITPSTKASATVKQSHAVPDAINTSAIKDEGSSEEDGESPSRDSGYGSTHNRSGFGFSSSSVPTPSGFPQAGYSSFAPASYAPSTGGRHAVLGTSSPNTQTTSINGVTTNGPTIGTFGAPTTPMGLGDTTPSVGSLPEGTSTTSNPHSAGYSAPSFASSERRANPFGNGFSGMEISGNTSARRPPYRHRHSASMSSSYTQSSVRGGVNSDDDEAEDDDIPFVASTPFSSMRSMDYPLSSSFGATGKSAGSARHLRTSRAGDDEFFGPLDEEDEEDDAMGVVKGGRSRPGKDDQMMVDDEISNSGDTESGSDGATQRANGNGRAGGAGMEIDMDL